MASFKAYFSFLLLALFVSARLAASQSTQQPPSPSPDLPADSNPISSPPSPSPDTAPSLPPSPSIASPPAPPPSAPIASPPAPPPSEHAPSESPSSNPAPATGTGEATSKSDSAAMEEEEKESGGMNGGKKAGIALGVIAVAGVAVVGCIVYKKRQENVRRSQYSYAARREFL